MFTGVAQHFRSRISYVEVPAQTVHEQDALIRVSGMTMGPDYGFSHRAQQGFWPGERAYPQVRIDFTRLRQGNDTPISTTSMLRLFSTDNAASVLVATETE